MLNSGIFAVEVGVAEVEGAGEDVAEVEAVTVKVAEAESLV